MLNHCRQEMPHEACGLLVGKNGNVETIISIPNVAVEPKSNFLADPVKQKEAFDLLLRQGWELMGIYHSHPQCPPIPSANDIRQAAYPQSMQVIVGLRNSRPDVRVYRVQPDKGTAVRVLLDLPGSKPSKRVKEFGRSLSIIGNWSV